MVRLWDSLFLAGVALLVMVCVVMWGDVGSVTRNDVLSVTRDVAGTATPKLLVSTTMSIDTQDHLDSFPTRFGGWESVRDYSDSYIQTRLSADSYILRDYQVKQQTTSPFFLLVLHSKLASSFHDPRV